MDLARDVINQEGDTFEFYAAYLVAAVVTQIFSQCHLLDPRQHRVAQVSGELYLEYCNRTSVQLPAGAESVTAGSQAGLYRPSSLSVATKITMASHSNAIIIADDEELLSLEPGSSRP
ncbi:uncharacterized protein N7518_004473 [Penicillium psychrosexuale]|uniref:uncharacterized protein n=1 Tax=Penicillium psychrosexuale TaxID=1002107 RepID=UPI002545A459|nr:uncharacterized protein N7518_004473 [Penicillium psychrosexuale]KAJ5795933.1 hypothetical protein N7518_004473 [Penicillium psychrosexuale]